MTSSRVGASWLLSESLTIGGVVLAGFLVAHLLGTAVDASDVALLHGLEGTLVAVVRYTTLLTALRYAISEGTGDRPPLSVHADE